MIIGLGTILVPKVLTFPTILCALGVVCASLDYELLNQVFTFAAMILEYALYAVGGIMALYGVGFKLYYGRWSAY